MTEEAATAEINADQGRRLRPAPFLLERVWFKPWKQPWPVLLHQVPEFVAHQLSVNIPRFDETPDARQLLWRKIIVRAHVTDDSRTRIGFNNSCASLDQ